MPDTKSQNPLALIFLLLAVLLSAAFYDIIFLNKTLKVSTASAQAMYNGPYGQQDNKPRFIPANGTDAPITEEPIYEFIKQNLQKGILPLWNPHQACGFSLIGMLETAIFFPLTLIIYIFPNIISWDLLILSRLLCAGFFTFWFMRRMGFKDGPALCSAIVFMLSGPMVLLQYWTANVDLLTPLVLLAMDRLIIREADARSTACASIAVGLTIFAGHPEHVFLVNAYGLAFFVFRLISLKPKNTFTKILPGFVAAYILGAGLAAIVLFPFLRNFGTEFWNGHPPGTGLLMEEQRDRFLTLALPHFFQKENLTYDFTFAGWWGGYIGTLPLALAYLSLFGRQTKGLNYFFGAMAILIIGKEYGMPFINWIGYLPVFDACRYAIHTPPLAAFSVAVLSGMGLNALMLSKKNFSKALLFTAGLAVTVAVHLWLLRAAGHFKISVEAGLFAMALLFIFLAVLKLHDHAIIKPKILNLLLMTLVFCELFLYIHREHPGRFDSFPEVPYINFLKSQQQPVRSYGIIGTLYPDTATGYGVDDLGYFLGLVPSRFVDFSNALLIKNHFQKDLRPPALRAIPLPGQAHDILDLLSVRYIIAPSSKVLGDLHIDYDGTKKHLPPAYEGEAIVLERPSALPRAFVVHRMIFAADKVKTLGFIKRLGRSAQEGVVITRTPERNIAQIVNTQPVRDSSSVEIASYGPNEVQLNASMENPGLVVLTDAYHPDWKATVDGKPAEIYQTDYLLRSVFVPEGRHEIIFTFSPLSFTAGLVVSLLSLLVLIGLFVCPHLLRRTKNPVRFREQGR